MAKVPFIVPDIEVDGTTLTVDETNNRVGIGTNSPGVALDVVGVIKGSDGVVTLTSAGAPTVSIEDGALAVDTTNDKFYIRSGSAWVDVVDGTVVTLDGTQTLTNKTLTSPIITDGEFQDTFTIGSQVFYEQSTNGFSVNEDFDASNSSTQTAYHYTSGAGRETVVFTVARTSNFTNGFGIYGTSASNALVNFGEAANTRWEWRNNVGIRPVDVDGGNLRMSLSSSGVLRINDAFSFPNSDGTSGQVLSTNGSGTVSWQSLSGGSGSVTTSDTPPSSPAAGDLWYESDTGSFYIYYDSQWISISGTVPSATVISDADGDTKVQTEESADEDKIRFDTAGVERAVLDSSGLTLNGKLTQTATGLNGSITWTGGVGPSGLEFSPSGVLESALYYRSTTNAWSFEDASANKIALFDADDLSVTFVGNLTVDTNTLFVDATNNRVGVGTTSPTSPLHVVGAATITGNLTVDTNTLFVNSTSNRVGVGTVTPSVTLDVSGIIKGSGGVVTLTSAGVPSATVDDGGLAVDTTNSKLYIRSGSAWVEAGGGTDGQRDSFILTYMS